MSDEEKRELWRKAGEGDLLAAERYVAILRREASSTIPPDRVIADLTDKDLGGVPGRRVRILNALHSMRIPGAPHKRIVTLLDLAELTEDHLRRTWGFGSVLAAVLNEVLARAGLKFKERYDHD